MTDVAVIDPFEGAYLFDSRPPGDGWEILTEDIYSRVWIRVLPEGGFQTCTFERVGPVLERNYELQKETDGKSWGDGQIVASIPLDKYFRDIVPARNNGDEKWIRKYLNDPDNSLLRTKRGRL